jgi:transcriptional regulator with XRE-family HTH domain
MQVLRRRAVELRLAGKSILEIKQILGPMSNSTLHDALRGTPPPEWTRRPRAKDERHAQARELRAQGLSYKEIAARLGVSKSSVSLWVHDLPVPERLSYEETRKRAAEGSARYAAAQRQVRSAQHAAEREVIAAQIGELSDRELLIAGAIAYWCEGSKSKPYREVDRVTFINSDPNLVRFFLRFLQVAGVPQEDLTFRIYIHETADVAAAERFWLDLTGAEAHQFRRATLKHHNPKTIRKNTGDAYHGCLKIDVLRSSGLYRKIEAWASAAMTPNFTTVSPRTVSWY